MKIWRILISLLKLIGAFPYEWETKTKLRKKWPLVFWSVFMVTVLSSCGILNTFVASLLDTGVGGFNNTVWIYMASSMSCFFIPTLLINQKRFIRFLNGLLSHKFDMAQHGKIRFFNYFVSFTLLLFCCSEVAKEVVLTILSRDQTPYFVSVSFIAWSLAYVLHFILFMLFVCYMNILTFHVQCFKDRPEWYNRQVENTKQISRLDDSVKFIPSDARISVYKMHAWVSDSSCRLESEILLVEDLLRNFLLYLKSTFLLCVLTSSIINVSALYYLIDSMLRHRSWENYFFGLSVSLYYGTTFFIICQTADTFNKSKKEVARGLRFSVAKKLLLWTPEMERILYLLERDFQFSVIGLFTLSRSTFTSVVGFVTSFLVVALQFRGISNETCPQSAAASINISISQTI